MKLAGVDNKGRPIWRDLEGEQPAAAAPASSEPPGPYLIERWGWGKRLFAAWCAFVGAGCIWALGAQLLHL